MAKDYSVVKITRYTPTGEVKEVEEVYPTLTSKVKELDKHLEHTLYFRKEMNGHTSFIPCKETALIVDRRDGSKRVTWKGVERRHTEGAFHQFFLLVEGYCKHYGATMELALNSTYRRCTECGLLVHNIETE